MQIRTDEVDPTNARERFLAPIGFQDVVPPKWEFGYWAGAVRRWYGEDPIRQSGTESVSLPPRSPDLSPHIERFMLPVKEECLHRMVLFGEQSLGNAVRDFLGHYHKERNNQGLDNRLIEPDGEVERTTVEIACRKRLGGMLRCCYRKVA